MQSRLTFISMTLFLINGFAYAGSVDDYDFRTQIFKPQDPNSSLVEFKVRTNSYKVLFTDDPNPSYGTTMYAEYSTKDLDQVQDYAVVQYIKGCMFESKMEVDGSLSKRTAMIREFFNKKVKFEHPQWVIDSVDVDPVYNSYPNFRHGAYRWNEVAGSYAKATEHYFLNQEPDTPRLYVRDLPSGAFEKGGSAKNVSLQFETCLIETSKVPLIATPSLDLRSEALACFSWNSSFVYNFQTKQYDSPKNLDPYCL